MYYLAHVIIIASDLLKLICQKLKRLWPNSPAPNGQTDRPLNFALYKTFVVFHQNFIKFGDVVELYALTTTSPSFI